MRQVPQEAAGDSAVAPPQPQPLAAAAAAAAAPAPTAAVAPAAALDRDGCVGPLAAPEAQGAAANPAANPLPHPQGQHSAGGLPQVRVLSLENTRALGSGLNLKARGGGGGAAGWATQVRVGAAHRASPVSVACISPLAARPTRRCASGCSTAACLSRAPSRRVSSRATTTPTRRRGATHLAARLTTPHYGVVVQTPSRLSPLAPSAVGRVAGHRPRRSLV